MTPHTPASHAKNNMNCRVLSCLHLRNQLLLPGIFSGLFYLVAPVCSNFGTFVCVCWTNIASACKLIFTQTPNYSSIILLSLVTTIDITSKHDMLTIVWIYKCNKSVDNTILYLYTKKVYFVRATCFDFIRSSSGPPRRQIQELFMFHCNVGSQMFTEFC